MGARLQVAGLKEVNAVEAVLKRFLDGDLYTPIIQEGTIPERKILWQLEFLRLKMLSERDKEVAYNEKNKTVVASVAHDFKTPLAIIAGYAESLQDGMDDKDYPTLLLQKVEQMNDLVQSILEVSKEEAASVIGKMERVNAMDYFTSELVKFKALAEKKKVNYFFGAAPNVTVRLERAKIARVLQNLISNAVHYTEEGGSVSVRFYVWQKRLCISVHDNGAGIAKENLPFVFDKFFREDAARSTANSGLGLYICKEIAEQHGGTIRVKSEKNKGSRFVLKLPLEPEIQENKSASEYFETFPKPVKLILLFLLGWILPAIYRIIRFRETRCVATLVGGIFAFPLFVFFWFIDLASVAAYNRITFLGE